VRDRAARPVIVSPLAEWWRLSPRAPDALLYVAAASFGVLGGASLMMDTPMWKLIQLALLLPCLVLPLTIQPEKVFVGWLFAAPFVQGAAAGPHHGHAFYKFLFLVPPLLLLARMAIGELDLRGFWIIDALPLLYLLYIVIRLHFFPSEFTGTEASARAVYTAVGIAAIAYYFTAFGKTSDGFPVAVARSLLWGGIIVALLTVIDGTSGWNLWNNQVDGGNQIRRAVSTFSSPGALGTYLGAGLAFAVAILVWDAPRLLRRPAIMLIVISFPALYFTYTRGPVLGVLVVTIFMLLIANRARWPSLLVIAAVGALLLVGWSEITSSATYRERLGVTDTVTTRVKIQDLSLELFRERPWFGWGYNSFDRAKLTSVKLDPKIGYLTSHDTYLTVLVELGIAGLALILLPWLIIGWRAVKAGWRGSANAWIVGASVGAAAVYAIGAFTYDVRFFSFVSALPWISLGLARNILGREERARKSRFV
jgi:O-antigen ligase